MSLRVCTDLDKGDGGSDPFIHFIHVKFFLRVEKGDSENILSQFGLLHTDWSGRNQRNKDL